MRKICCKSKFLAAILKNNLFLVPMYYCKCLTNTPYYHFLVFLPRNTTLHGSLATAWMEMWKITKIDFIFILGIIFNKTNIKTYCSYPATNVCKTQIKCFSHLPQPCKDLVEVQQVLQASHFMLVAAPVPCMVEATDRERSLGWGRTWNFIILVDKLRMFVSKEWVTQSLVGDD